MAGGLLFVTQAVLDSWAGQGKIELTGNILTLLQGAGKGRSYALEPAVRFLKVLGAEVDPHKLLAKVKQISQLRELGAEQVSDSVIVGEVAYEVESGFLAEAAALQAVSTATAGEEVPAKPVAPRAVPPAKPVAPRAVPPANPVAPRAVSPVKPVAPRAVPPVRPVAPRAVSPAQVVAPPGGPPVKPAPKAEVLAQPAPPPAQRQAPLPRDLEEKRKEAEALARFLLENLS